MMATIERVLLFKRCALFSQIPGEELVHIAQACDEVEYAPGSAFFREGDPADACYLIVTGSVQIQQQSRPLYDAAPGFLLGEIEILADEAHSASAFALSEVGALKINREDLNEVIAVKSEVARGLLKALARKLKN